MLRSYNPRNSIGAHSASIFVGGMVDNAAPAALLFFADAPETSKAVMTQTDVGT